MESAAIAEHSRACFISRLPYHVIKLIFCKLPVFSLTYSCRYVCKLWQRIIMDPEFAKFHLLMRNPNDILLCVDGRNLYWLEFHRKSSYLNLAANLDCKSLYFLNSCNGLVCACLDAKFLHVINPITCEYFSCPPCEEGMNLVARLSGVGFDPKTSKFKVLRCIYPHGNFKPFQFEVCTLGNGTWRSVVDLPRFDGLMSTVSSPGAFVNGSLHFLAGLRQGSARIWAFDFTSEQFRSMLLPSVFYDHNYYYCSANVGVTRDSIIISCLADASDKVVMKVWVMKEYGTVESWTKMLVLDCLPNSGIRLSLLPSEIRHLKNGDFLLYYPPNLFLYKPETTILTKLDTQGIRFTSCPISHSPSFASLKDVVGDRSKVLDARARKLKKDMNYTF